MSARPSLDDYIDVAERIMTFSEKYPEGSLQTLDWSVKDVAGQTFIVYRAAAYRTPDDERPGHGTAWEPFPGATPYTKNSELMNAETAAWGRAIVAVGLAANRKIASKQEVRGRQEEQADASKRQEASGRANGSPQTLPAARVTEVVAAIKRAKMPLDWARMQLVAVGAPEVPDGPILTATLQALTPEQATELIGICDEAANR